MRAEKLHVPHRRGQADTTTLDGKVSSKLGSGNSTLILAEIGQVDFEAAATFNGGPGKNTPPGQLRRPAGSRAVAR